MMIMMKATATEFARHFGRYQDEAQRVPVCVKTHERVVGYFMSAHEFDEYQALKAQRVALPIEDFSAEMLDALAHSRMDPEHDHLNAYMDEGDVAKKG